MENVGLIIFLGAVIVAFVIGFIMIAKKDSKF